MIAKALTGDYRPEQVFVLKQELSLYEVYQTESLQQEKKMKKLAN